MLNFKNYAKSERERESKNSPSKIKGILKITLTSLIAALACTGIIYAATTVGTNISTDGTITGSGANTLYGATSIGGALTATSTLTVSGLTTLGNASTTLLSVSGNSYLAATTLSGVLNMGTNLIQNIGAAGTDFTATGGLTLADALTISSGGMNITGDSSVTGDLTVTEGISASSTYSNFNGRDNLDAWDAAIANIVGSGTGQAKILWIGDSWAAIGNHVVDTTKWLHDRYGHAGSGYVAAGTTTDAPAGITRAITGTWTNSAASPYTIGMGSASASDITATLDITGVATSMVIHYLKKSGGGTFHYRVDAGGWTDIDTSAVSTTLNFETISGLTDGSHLLEIDITGIGTNGVELSGVEIIRTKSGVRVNNVAVGGTRAEWYADANVTEWAKALVQVDPDLVIISLGVNDLIANTTPETYKFDLETITSRLETALPGVSILIFTQGDIGTATTYPMSDFVTQEKSLAVANNFGYVDNYNIIGDYVTANSRGLYTNVNHLDIDGYSILTNSLEKYLNDSDNLKKLSTIDHSFSLGTGNLRQNLTGTYNFIVGDNIMPTNTSGAYNQAQGLYVLVANTTGSANLGNGPYALNANTTGNNNNAFGYQSQYNNIDGVDNSSFGMYSLRGNITGDANTAFGSQALLNTTAGYNSAGGSFSMRTNITGGSNAAWGANALFSNSSGSYNSVLGTNSAYSVTGSSNLVLGRNAAFNMTAMDNSVILGDSVCSTAANCGAATADNIFAIDSADVTSPLLFGSFANGSEYIKVNGELTSTMEVISLTNEATFAVARNYASVACSVGCTISTITGAAGVGEYTFLFADALSAITDTDAHTANTVDLNAVFTSADDTVLKLFYDGTSWYEVSRSVN
jgi:lysophospholipase L1-like esterase